MSRESARDKFTPKRESEGWGARLQQARKRAGLTQAQVAEELVAAGLFTEPRYQTVSEWEREERSPTVTELTWLRERYGFDADWLVSGLEPGWEAEAYRKVRAAVVEAEASALPEGRHGPEAEIAARFGELVAAEREKQKEKKTRGGK